MVVEPVKLAGCIILNDQREILLLHRHTDNHVHWETPGGKLEPGETPEEAAVREVKEEIGVVVKLLKQLGTVEFDDIGGPYHYTWFLAAIEEGSPAPQEPDKHDDVAYFSWEQLSGMTDLSRNTFKFLKQFVEPPR